jgi:hypothetical protein
MTREEMLKRMRLTEEELHHLLKAFRKFYTSLNQRQQAVVKRSLPSLDQAAKSFGPDVKPPDIVRLFDTDNSGGSFNSEIGELQPNGDGNGNGNDNNP